MHTLFRHFALSTPAPTPSMPHRRSRRALFAGTLVVIIVAVAIVAVVLTLNAGLYNINPSQSQTNVKEASSLKFSVSGTSDSKPYSFTLQAKNIGTDNMMLRVDGTVPGVSQSVIYIINGAQHKAWGYVNDEWVDLSNSYDSQWTTWNNLWNSYLDDLTKWSGTGDYTYTNPSTGDTTRLYDVQVNPEIPDSVFAP